MKTFKDWTNLSGLAMGAVLLIFLLQIAISCKDKDLYTAPVFGSTTFTNIKTSDATIAGKVVTPGSGIIKDYGFVYDSKENPTIASKKVSLGATLGTTQDIGTTISGLVANTKYYVRAYVTDDHQSTYSAQADFTTANLQPPKVTSGDGSDMNTSSFSVTGRITETGSGEVSQYGHVLSETNKEPTTADSPTKLGAASSAPKDFTSTFTSLKAGTAYYVRAYATNATGTAYSDVKTIKTTSEVPPTASTESITNIQQNSATVGVKRLTLGTKADAVVGVCWSSSNQNPTPADSKTEVGSNTAPEFFSLNLGGLKSNTLYYVRGYVTSKTGTGYGDVKTFTTKDVTPPTVAAAVFSSSKTCGILDPSVAPFYEDPCKGKGDPAPLSINMKFTYSQSAGGENIVKVGICAKPENQDGDPVTTDKNLESTTISGSASFFYNEMVVTGNKKTVNCGTCPTGGGVFLGVCGNQTAREYKFNNPLIVPYTIYYLNGGTKKSMFYKYRSYVVTASGKVFYGQVVTVDNVDNCNPQ